MARVFQARVKRVYEPNRQQEVKALEIVRKWVYSAKSAPAEGISTMPQLEADCRE